MPIVTLPGGQVRDEIRQPLYDSISLAAAVSPVGSYQFYSSTTVAGVPKALSQTNLTQPNTLPTATSFRVQGLCLDASNSDEDNFQVLPIVLAHSSLQLTIGQKIYWQGPGRFAAGRAWAAYATAVGATNLEYVLQEYGVAAIQPVCFKGQHVIDINPLQNFVALWQIGGVGDPITAGEITSATPASGKPVTFTFSMKGLLRRPVQ